MENRIERGQIYFIFLDPAFGREIGGFKTRPVVVVSANDSHQNTRIVAIVPGTTTGRRTPTPREVKVNPESTNQLREATYFQCNQVRAVDQGRMTGPAIGRLSRADLLKIEDALRISLGLP